MIGIITGLVTGAVISFYLTPTGQAARHIFSQPSCTDPQWLLQVPQNEVLAYAYYAQSDQIPGYGAYHVADNTIDGDLNTSWLQFWPSYTTAFGKSSSDYIQWSFAHRYNVRLICIVDGWPEDINTYRATLPVRAATVYASSEDMPPTSGSPVPSKACSSQRGTFKDYLQKNGAVIFADQWQFITFHCVTNNIVLHVDSVSKISIERRANYLIETTSNGHTAPLTGVSEVKFYYCPAMLCMF